MYIKYKISDAAINEMNLTLSITMTVAEWRLVMKNDNTLPAASFKNYVSQAIGELSKATDKEYKIPDYPNAKDND